MKRKAFAIIIALSITLIFFSQYFAQKVIKKFALKDTAISLTLIDETNDVSLKKDDYVLFGKYLDEPILWKVLSVKNNKVLLMTEYIISFKAFDSCGLDKDYHIGKDVETFGSSNWADSSLKQWLNSTEKTVTYSHCPPDENNTHDGYNSYSEESGFLCNNNFSAGLEMISDEGVFLLSKSELSNYLTSTKRIKTCTKSAVLQSNSPYITTTSQRTWYWTSSPVSSNNVSVTTVTSSGGFYKSLAYDGLCGVSPSLFLISNQIKVCSGDGRYEKPYLIYGNRGL